MSSQKPKIVKPASVEESKKIGLSASKAFEIEKKRIESFSGDAIGQGPSDKVIVKAARQNVEKVYGKQKW